MLYSWTDTSWTDFSWTTHLVDHPYSWTDTSWTANLMEFGKFQLGGRRAVEGRQDEEEVAGQAGDYYETCRVCRNLVLT
jgi:hypothetical protein